MSREILAVEMLRFFPLLHRKFIKQVKKGKLRGNEFMILAEVAHHDGLPMRSYGERLTISKPNLTKVVDVLEMQGLLRRQSDEHDRRIINLHITNQGRKMMKEHFEYSKRMLVADMASVSDDDVVALKDHFMAINEILMRMSEDVEQK